MLLVDQGFKLSAPALEKSRHRVTSFHCFVRGRASDSNGKRFPHSAMVIPAEPLMWGSSTVGSRSASEVTVKLIPAFGKILKRILVSVCFQEASALPLPSYMRAEVDETSDPITANLIVWKDVQEQYRRPFLASRLWWVAKEGDVNFSAACPLT